MTEPRQPTRRLDQPKGVGPRFTFGRADPDRFGRFAERVARFTGTARFLILMSVIIVVWLLWNTLAPRHLRFDPYTFTFLTLLLSLQASYAAPFILLAQNRQADRDRVQLEEDRLRAAAAKADTEYLARELAALRIAIGDVATRDFLRSELARMQEDDRRRDERAERERLERAERERLERAERERLERAERADSGRAERADSSHEDRGEGSAERQKDGPDERREVRRPRRKPAPATPRER